MAPAKDAVTGSEPASISEAGSTGPGETDRRRTRGPARLDVALRVPDHHCLAEDDLGIFSGGTQQESGRRFATTTPGGNVVRAEVARGQSGAGHRELPDQPVVNPAYVCRAGHSTGDAALVGHQHDLQTAFVQCAYRRCGTGQHYQVGRVGDVATIRGLDVEGAVTIEKNSSWPADQHRCLRAGEGANDWNIVASTSSQMV
jgi:hypothetical protein